MAGFELTRRASLGLLLGADQRLEFGFFFGKLRLGCHQLGCDVYARPGRWTLQSRRGVR